MAETITAIYEHGVLRPTTPLDLPEHAEVQVTVVATAPSPATEFDRVQAILRAGGIAPPRPPRTPDEQPLTDEEQAGLDARVAALGGTPLSNIIIEEREEYY